MSKSKLHIVLLAFSEIRINGTTVQPNPKQVDYAINVMDAMVDGWKDYGLCLGYKPSPEEIDPGQESGLSDRAVTAVALNLAESVAPAYGKTVSPTTISRGSIAYSGLFGTSCGSRENNPYMPLGAGSNRYGFFDRARYQSVDSRAPDDCSTLQLKVGQTKTFTVDLTNEFELTDTISSFDSEVSEGVSLDSSAELDGVFTLVISGIDVGANTIKLTLLLDPSADINPVTININVV